MNESTTDISIVPLPTGQDVLTELLRDRARRMLARAIEAEVAAWIHDHFHLKDDDRRQQVVHNGHLPGRTIQTGIGPIEVRQPRVRDRRPADQREAFTSAVLLPYLRKITWAIVERFAAAGRGHQGDDLYRWHPRGLPVAGGHKTSLSREGTGRPGTRGDRQASGL